MGRTNAVLIIGALALALALGTALQQIGRTGQLGDGPGEFYEPCGVFVVGGKLYVAERLNYRVSVFDLDGNHVGQIGAGLNGSLSTQFNEPEDVFVADNRVYVADAANHRVSMFDLDGNSVGMIGTGTEGDAPDQFSFPVSVFVRDGNVFVSDIGNHRISVFNSTGAPQYRIAGLPGAEDGRLESPYGIYVTATEVYVADMENDRISVFNRAGLFRRHIGDGTGSGPGQLLQPRDVFVDEGSGRVFVADSENHRVQVFDRDGGHLGQYGTGKHGSGPLELNTPHGIFLFEGKVYITDQANQRILIRQEMDYLTTIAEPTPAVVEHLGRATVAPSATSTVEAIPSSEAISTPSPSPSPFRGFALVPLVLTFVVLSAGFTLALARELSTSGLLTARTAITFDVGHGQDPKLMTALSPLISTAEDMECEVQRESDIMSVLKETDVLVVANPVSRYTEDEVSAIIDSVRYRGMGLLILASGLGSGDANACTSLSGAFGIRFNKDLVCDYELTDTGYRVTVAPLLEGLANHPILKSVGRMRIFRSCSLSSTDAMVLAFGSKESFGDQNLNLRYDDFEKKGLIPIMVATTRGKGRVLCIGDYRVVSSEAPFEHTRLMRNVLEWLRGEGDVGADSTVSSGDVRGLSGKKGA
ncbi:MAG: NHL repeat-containing protein [Candidatus Undinarchaeales archaeon]|nr:NHL repeat-containing protein [Candidatus Undinarchaeales archaeon]MDP7491825.1 NHL repeat-containing protein [Candidatus Undinarchaeales archaeon]